MELSEILKSNAVKVLDSMSSKKRLLNELSNLIGSAYDLPPGDVLSALSERETLGPTGVGRGVALPHARLDGLTGVIGAFLLVQKPVDFDAVDRQPVDLVFGLLAPANAGVTHLRALAAVSRTLRDTAICTKLRKNPVPQTLHTILLDAGTLVQAA